MKSRYAINNFSPDWPKKTSGQKVLDFLGTQIYNLMLSNVANMHLPLFKKYIFHWLRHEYNATKN